MKEMSTFWSWWIIVLTVGNILACVWLIRWTAKKTPGEATEGDVTGHTWDGNLQEYNNPLPRWWLWLFYITIVFGAGYLYLYPGLGNYAGALNWSEESQYDEEMAKADETYGPIFAAYAQVPVAELAKNSEATAVGQRLYLNYCAQCHGSAATGSPGFPNLTDNDWLWGGSADQIKTTIMSGRNGVMPPHAHLGADKIDAVATYVSSLSGRSVDAAKAAEGKNVFMSAGCIGCHGMDAKGNTMLGAPNLTDDVWLYGSSMGAITKTITEGRSGVMPAHGEFLGNDKVHVVSAFVYSLSNN